MISRPRQCAATGDLRQRSPAGPRVIHASFRLQALAADFWARTNGDPGLRPIAAKDRTAQLPAVQPDGR